MSRLYSRRQAGLLGLGALGAAGPLWAEAPLSSVRPALRPGDMLARITPPAEEIIRRAGLSGEVAYLVADAETGLRLESGRALEGMPPASVAKALTALYALEILGHEHRFSTQLRALGPVRDGVLMGDLALVGDGDPMLDTDGLAKLLVGVKRAGVKAVRGRLLVAGAPFPEVASIDPGQPAHLGYSPAVAGLALNYNRVHFQWRGRGTKLRLSLDARSESLRPEVSMARIAVAERTAPVFDYHSRDGLDDWTVARSALTRDGSRWLPVRKPVAYAGDVLRTLARSNGLRLTAPELVAQPPEGDILSVIEGPPLRVVLAAMLRYSTNLIAEMVGLAATLRHHGSVPDLAGSARVMNEWLARRFDVAGVALADHSGLGERSRISAEAMVDILVRAHAEGALPALLKTFPMQDAPGAPQVRAKTGTLNFVSGLAGYATGQNGATLAFAFFGADLARRGNIRPSDRERPRGGRAWAGDARELQRALLLRWGRLYGM